MGIIIGTICLNMMINTNGDVLIEMVESYHAHMKYTFVPSYGLWIRVCMYRMSIAFIVMCCIHWMQSYDILFLIIGIGGMACGYTLSLLSYCYGIKGILCMIVYLVPHGFIYIPAVLSLIRKTSSQIYTDFAFNLKGILMVFLVFSVGCGLETYINPMFLKMFLKKIL